LNRQDAKSAKKDGNRFLISSRPSRFRGFKFFLPRRREGREEEEENLAVALHVAHYTFCRVHGTTRITPAMAAGVTDHVWELDELLAAI
jgi:hypothetical protein